MNRFNLEEIENSIYEVALMVLTGETPIVLAAKGQILDDLGISDVDADILLQITEEHHRERWMQGRLTIM